MNNNFIFFSKIFQKNVLIYMFSQFIARGLTFLALPLFTYYLSPANFGTYELFTRYISLVSLILMLGLPSYILIDYVGKSLDYIKNLVKNLQSIFFYSVIIYSILFLLAVLFFYKSFPLFLIITAYLCSILVYFTNFSENYLRISAKIKLLSFFLILGVILNLSISLLGLIIFKLSYRSLILGYTINQTIFFGYYFYFLKKNSITSLILRPDFSILKKSLFFIPNSFLSLILLSIGSWLLLYHYSPNEVGLFSLALKFGLFYDVVIAQPVNVVYVPYFFRQLNNKGTSELKSHFLPIFLLIILIAIVLIIPSSFYNRLSLIIRNKAYFESFKYIKYTLSSYLLLHAISLVNMIFMHYKKLEKITFYLFFGAIFNIILNLILIPKYSIYGAAITMFLSYLLIFIISLILSRLFILKLSYQKIKNQ